MAGHKKARDELPGSGYTIYKHQDGTLERDVYCCEIIIPRFQSSYKGWGPNDTEDWKAVIYVDRGPKPSWIERVEFQVSGRVVQLCYWVKAGVKCRYTARPHDWVREWYREE